MKVMEKEAEKRINPPLLLRRVHVGNEESGRQHAVCLLQQSTAFHSLIIH